MTGSMLTAAVILTVAASLVCTPTTRAAAEGDDAVKDIFARVSDHAFHPIDDRAFTIDRDLGRAGIADINDTDWRVRLLAVRDLVRLGGSAADRIADGLTHENPQVRYLCATALGALKAGPAMEALRRTLREDDQAVVRSQAAVALGQINDKESLQTLRDTLAGDPSKDVRHQCELSIDQIEKGRGATDELLSAYRDLDAGSFETVRVGQAAPSFTLIDTEGEPHNPVGQRGDGWVVLIWVFADWCPVCHGEFRELIEMRDEFHEAGVGVYTIEAHDLYRARVMVGKEVDPEYWFAQESFQDVYTHKIWWPHLVDRAGAVGAAYGVDPMAFSVHAEYINRPSTIIIDPTGTVRLAYYGTFWGDRPSIRQTLDMIRDNDFTFVHPKRLTP